MKFWPEDARPNLYIEVPLAVVCLILAVLFRENFTAAFICVAALIVLVVRMIDWKRHVILRRAVTASAVLVAVSFLVVEVFVFSGFGTDDEPAGGADYVIILGSGLKGTELSLTLKQRLDASLPYLNQHKAVPVIVSGGRGPGEDITEAEAMKRYLVDRGISEERILLEDRSTSTKENLLFSKTIIQGRGGKSLKILIVTSDFHMFRAKYIARKLGYNEVYSLAGESPTYLKPMNLIREYLAVIKALL
ncbi:YdcF family protein [Paenibacillus sp. J22TS3]|uniref:YdcF family protein n=1 Tax=Paenibacillus sp. J22TS3 TaxID=2807192 RepID=UPI001B091A39|nr:YdcF family protein [Paenibacillus sp. J22TS3]GIP24683.1 hypothetical protein J22TS3_49580 [Paenibacillus sp. J22TS3]